MATSNETFGIYTRDKYISVRLILSRRPMGPNQPKGRDLLFDAILPFFAGGKAKVEHFLVPYQLGFSC